MPSECIQALNPELSDIKSPESLYLKEDSLFAAQNSSPPLITFNSDPSPTLSSDVSLKQEKITHSSLHDNFRNFDIFGKFVSNLECLQEPEFESQLREYHASDCSTDASPNSTFLSPGSLSPTTPMESYMDTNTQMSLCERSEAMQLEDALANLDPAVISDIANEVSQSLPSPPINVETPRKVRKSSEMSDAPNSAVSQATSSPVPFDAGAAVSSPQFIFTQFGKDVPGLCSFSGESTQTTSTSNILSIRTAETAVPTECNFVKCDQELEPLTLVLPNQKKLKEPSLNMTFPAKSNGVDLKIVVQPEDNHRARYMTEGSRGAVKDKKQEGFPIVKLCGYTKESAILQVFIGNDTGKVKPHGFYQACKVCGKTASQCKETDIEGTTVIEIPLEAKDDMTARIDCVGILKLRNADVEKRIGLARSKKKKVPTATLR